MEKKNIKKIDLAMEVSRGTGLNLVDSSEIVDLFFNILSEGIELEKEVKIMGRGTFVVKHKEDEKNLSFAVFRNTYIGKQQPNKSTRESAQ